MSLNSSTTSHKPIKVCCSNFTIKTKKAYEQFIVKLGGIYEDQLSFDTNVLMAGNVLSNKYNSACIIQIPIVTAKWLDDSVQAGKFLPTNDYLLPIFQDVKIGLLGFNEQELEELKQIIHNEKGNICTSINEMEKTKSPTLILIKKKELKRYQSFIDSLNIPAVSIDWLKNCLLRKQFVKLDKYSVASLKDESQMTYIQKCDNLYGKLVNFETNINLILNEQDAGNHNFLYFQKCIIYFHKLNEKIEKITKKMVNAGGGTYVKEFIPNVTHVITIEYYSNTISEFNKYRPVKIVDVNWLKDCLQFKRLIPEDDYYIQPILEPSQNIFKNSNDINKIQGLARRNTIDSLVKPNFVAGNNTDMLSNSKAISMSKSSFINGNTRTVAYNQDIITGIDVKKSTSVDANVNASANECLSPLANKEHTPNTFRNKSAKDLINDKTYANTQQNDTDLTSPPPPSSGNPNTNALVQQSISGNTSSRSDRLKGKKSPALKINSTLFKNLQFYFDPSHEELAIYKKKVLENGGNILKNYNVFEELFYVMQDGPESQVMIEKLKKNKNLARCISHRWIDYCLQRKTVFKPFFEMGLIHLMPLPSKTPFLDFLGKKVYASGFNLMDEQLMKEIFSIFGAQFKYEPNELAVFCCDNKSSKKYLEISRNYQKVPIVNSQWVLACLTQGKFVDPTNFKV